MYHSFDGARSLLIQVNLLLQFLVDSADHRYVVTADDIEPQRLLLQGLIYREHALVGIGQNNIRGLVEAFQRPLNRRKMP